MEEVKIGPWLMTYDDEAGAGYLYFFPEKRGQKGVCASTEEAEAGINIDYMADGTPFGIEVYGVYIGIKNKNG